MADVELSLKLGGDTTMKLGLIPAGTFTMGSPAGEAGRGSDEGPLHEVTIGKPFYMGVHEVKRGQFAAFVKDEDYRTEAEKQGWSYADGQQWGKVAGVCWRKPGFEQNDDHPVVCVSFEGCLAVLCAWLSKKTDRKVRLPTEAEWEYACRAGGRTRFYFGDEEKPLSSYGWFQDNSDGRMRPACLSKPMPLAWLTCTGTSR